MKPLRTILITDEMNHKTSGESPPQRKSVAPYLLAPGHTVSEIVDKVLAVPFDQAVMHHLVDHLLCTLDDLVHGQRQVRPVQFVVHLPGAAVQHVFQTTVFYHGPVAEDGGDAAGLKFLT